MNIAPRFRRPDVPDSVFEFLTVPRNFRESMAAPTGTITFLFTDIEGSSRLWERHPVDMGPALERHDVLVRNAMERHDGFVFKTVGDAFCAAFHTASDALRAAVDAQKRLFSEPWGETGPLRVRMSIHVGSAELRENDYFGNTLNRVSRILAAAHGGQILMSLPVEELVRDHLPLEVSLRNLGEQRLRDLSRPEQLFQVVINDIPAEFPPLRSIEAMPNNLPASLSTFIGRDRDLAEVKRLLKSARLLTLMGTGGTGKTRLSIEVAAHVLDEFAQGVWLVELATISEPQRVVEAIATALGIREDPDQPLRRSLFRYLRDKSALLVLDNCEHVLAECAVLAAELLRTSSHLRILATSRHALGINGEMTWWVPPLAFIDPARDLFQVPDVVAKVSQYESACLFVDRASAAKPGFQMTQQNAAAIAQICWRLDGIPLAIELAAARTKVLGPEQIAARLDDRFHLLTGSNRAALPHQQTLRALIDWSHDLLSESERILFRRLGVFGGGRTIEAIEAVCAGGEVGQHDALDLIQQLVDKSLIAVEFDADGGERYTMIESVWQYARERLEESGEAAALRDRHLDYFVALAESGQPGLESFDLPEWLDRIAAERINFRLALDWASKSAGNAEKGLRIAGSLTRFWEIRGHLEEARQHFEAALAAPGAEKISIHRGKALSGAGRIAWCQDRTADASRFYSEAIDVFEKLGETRLFELSRAFLGFINRNAGDLDAAEEKFRTALDAGKSRQDVLLTAVGLSGMGTVAGERGDAAMARRLKEESLAIYRAAGDKWIIGYLLWGIARACIADHDAAKARSALDEWSETAFEMRNRWVFPYILQGFGDTLMLEGRGEKAARVFGAAEAGREALGISLDQVDKADLAKSIDRLRSAVQPETLASEWSQGRQMTLWDAVKFARNLT